VVSARPRRDLTPGRYPGENLFEFWQRRHDELHGSLCGCPWNTVSGRGPRPPGLSLDTVPEGRRLAIYRGPAGS
jgi:hypothetical protein